MAFRLVSSSVLFVCTMNASRSPMAAGLMRHFHGASVWIKSAGVRTGTLDSFAVSVMDEIGIDISEHVPVRFAELEDLSFDLVIALSPEARLLAERATRSLACEVEFWNTFDPSEIEGPRERKLDAYREVRHSLLNRILARFPLTENAVMGQEVPNQL